jgi:hypothetical protein
VVHTAELQALLEVMIERDFPTGGGHTSLFLGFGNREDPDQTGGGFTSR